MSRKCSPSNLLRQPRVLQFEAGRARMRLVLERQDQLSESRLQAIEAQVNWKLAELQLLAVTGDVLTRFGIDIQTR